MASVRPDRIPPVKPIKVINHGEQFVTLRATTDRPAEIREALAARDVQLIYKGDQNQAWDAVLSNHCLSRALAASDTPVCFFVQDERLGTADARVARMARAGGRRYLLTEDYYRSLSGAVWEHQDAACGLFYTEAVSPAAFASAAVHLGRLGQQWELHSARCLEDAGWLRALADLGVTLPGTGPASPATRLGGVAEQSLDRLGDQEPSALLFYSLTKTDGLYGIVPSADENVTLSSIPAGDPEIRALARRLLVQVAARGAMRQTASAALRRGVRQRARALAQWAGAFLDQHPDTSIAGFQQALGRWLTGQIFPADQMELATASRLAAVKRGREEDLADPREGLHYFLNLALRHPAEFVESYNQSLNRVGLGLQRLRWDPESGHLTLPFFIEFVPPGGDGRTYRFTLELHGTELVEIRLANPAQGLLKVISGSRIDSARSLFRALFQGLPGVDEIVAIGKAAPFAAELQRAPRGLGLPRQGSRYSPMVDHLLAGLKARGVLCRPTGLLIRIGLNLLDQLQAMGQMRLRLPRFLEPAMGREITCIAFSRRWRSVAREAQDQLELLSRLEVGQHVHFIPLLAQLRLGADPGSTSWTDGLRRIVAQFDGGAAWPRLAALAREMGESTAREVVRLAERREHLLGERRRRAMSATRSATGRLIPQQETEAGAERESIELRLAILQAALVRRLHQRAESLPYLNDRPYTLGLWLLFGPAIFPAVCRRVEFDVEYISLAPLSEVEQEHSWV